MAHPWMKLWNETYGTYGVMWSAKRKSHYLNQFHELVISNAFFLMYISGVLHLLNVFDTMSCDEVHSKKFYTWFALRKILIKKF